MITPLHSNSYEREEGECTPPPVSRSSRDHSRDKVDRINRDFERESGECSPLPSRDTKRSYSHHSSSDKHYSDKVDRISRPSSATISEVIAESQKAQEEIVKLILGDSRCDDLSKYSCKDIAYACKTVASFDNITYLDNEMIKRLLDHFIDGDPYSKFIAIILNSLGKLVEKAEEHFSDRSFPALCRLVRRIVNKHPNAQDIANTVLGMSKFVEKGFKLEKSKETMDAVCELVRLLYNKGPRAHNISNTVLGLGKFVTNGYKLSRSEDTVASVCRLVRDIQSKNPNPQAISNTVVGLSNLVSKGYKLSRPEDTMASVSKLANGLINEDSDSQTISNLVLSFSKFADNGYISYISKEDMRGICKLLISLSGKDPNAQQISNTLFGFKIFVDLGFEINDAESIMAAECTLVKKLATQKITADRHISKALTGLCSCLRRGFKLDDADETMAASCLLVRKLQKLDLEFHTIASTVFALGTFVRYGYELDDPDATMEAIGVLIARLLELEPDSWATAYTLFGASLLVKCGYSFAKQETLDALLTLMRRMPTKQPTAQDVCVTIKALRVLLKQNNDDVMIAVGALLEDLERIRTENVNICEILFALSEMAFTDNDNWANRLIKRVSWGKQRNGAFTSPNVIIQGILGYARLLQRAPDAAATHAVTYLIRRLQNMKVTAKIALSLIQAYGILKEKGADHIANYIKIDLLQKQFLASDPTKEEKEQAGIAEEVQAVSPPQDKEEAIPVTGWCQLTDQKVALTPMQKPTTYDLTTYMGRGLLEAHLQSQGIKFAAENVPLIISPVFVIQNQLGAFANEPLLPGQFLGKYVGERVDGEQAIAGSMYAFDITDGEEGPECFLDAEKYRNFTAFLNHSAQANIATTTKKGAINFQVAGEQVLKNEQCFINYGDDFFPMLGFEPLYLDPHDSWESFDELVLQNRQRYLPHVAYLSSELQEAFKLPTQKVLLTKLAHAILTGDDQECVKLIESEADLWNYCVGDTTIMAPQKQQRFTPLMLACYLGRTTVVRALLQKSNINARLMQTGENAAFFALKGKAENRLELFQLLLDHGVYYNQTNREGVSLLNIAVEENLPEVVELLLNGKSTQERNELLDAFANSQSDSLHTAIVSGKLDAAKALLKKTTQSWLAPKIVDRELLVLKALEETTHFEKALQALMEAGNIHKNFAVINALMSRLGDKAKKLVKAALEAKQWPNKERQKLEAF